MAGSVRTASDLFVCFFYCFRWCIRDGGCGYVVNCMAVKCMWLFVQTITIQNHFALFLGVHYVNATLSLCCRRAVSADSNTYPLLVNLPWRTVRYVSRLRFTFLPSFIFGAQQLVTAGENITVFHLALVVSHGHDHDYCCCLQSF